MGKPYFMLIASILLCWNTVAQANVDDLINDLQSKPYKLPKASNTSNQEIYSRYCTGKAYDLKRPTPKYSHSLVKNAAKKLQQTQKDADAKLLEMFQESWVSTVADVKRSVIELKDSSNPVVLSMAEKIESSLDETATGFTSQQRKWYETLVDASFVEMKKSLNTLKNVIAEFKGVDYVKVTSLTSQFKDGISGELKSVDVEKLKVLAQGFESEVKSYQANTDVQALKSALTVVAEEFKTLTSEDQEFQWAVDNINYGVEQLGKNPPNLEEAKYVVQDVVYFFTDEYYSNIDYSAEAIKQSKVIISQALALSSEENLQTIKNLVDAIESYQDGNNDVNQVRWIAEDLQRSLKNYTSVSTNAAFIQNAKDFSAESASFNSENLMSRVVQINMALSDADSSNDQQAVSSLSSLQYEVEQMKELLSQKSLDLYAVIYAEAKKVEQEEVKVELQQVLDLAASSDANGFMEQASWQIDNVARMLEEQKAALSVGAQKAIEKFSSENSNFRVVSQLQYQMSSDLELKKAGHFYFYGHVKRIYKVNSGSAPFGKIAHTFLVQLCGEFRDRATMIEAKLKWIQRLYTINDKSAVSAIDYNENIWEQMSAADYYPFLDVTRELWYARKSAGEAFIQIGQYDSIDTPVKGPTVCETKYIFDKYIKAGKSFDNLEQYNKDYEETYKAKCTIQADLEDYYDFRGDSNFKHYSPESNGMIWKATSIARACSSPWKAKKTVSGSKNNYTDQDCKDYFRRPFYYRYNAARSALATGLVYDSQFDDSFDSEGDAPVTVYSHMKPQYAPMSYETETSNGVTFSFAPEWMELQQWNQSDIGFNDFTGLGGSQPNMELAYERLRGSVDRHTNWYSAGYNDGNGTVKDQAFSPFVASSYVMSASDEFTTCGITVQCPPDGLKRWMFIFRVKPQNWYNPQRILDNEPVNFDTMWFDETSFGDSGLANGESAWDRLGTAMESELDSILYLINVEGGGDHHGEFGDEPLAE